MKKLVGSLAAALMVVSTVAQADLIISQYVETDSGTTPKGVELWNTGASTIDFSVTGLDILKGTNGGALASDFTLNSGTLAAGEVMVVGSADIGTYLDSTFGAGVIQFQLKGFTYNGDDALQVQLGGVVQDTFGQPGVDPGTHWAGGGVETRNQNIALRDGITTGNTVGFSDPSTRFTTVSTTPSGQGGLDGFGAAPGAAAIPEPSTLALLGLSLVALVGARRKTRR